MSSSSEEVSAQEKGILYVRKHTVLFELYNYFVSIDGRAVFVIIQINSEGEGKKDEATVSGTINWNLKNKAPLIQGDRLVGVCGVKCML